jgi:hypothetical protein
MDVKQYADARSSKFPLANLPNQVVRGEVIKPCIHCGQQIALSRWDSWNGFLVECPFCYRLHGSSRNLRLVLLAGFAFNALSFLFLLRPKWALCALGAHLAYIGVGHIVIDKILRDQGLIWIIWSAGILLLPMLVNGVILLMHEHELGSPPRIR